LLGKALMRTGAFDPTYHTEWKADRFVSMAESRVPRRCRPGCAGVLSYRSLATGSASQEEEDVATGGPDAPAGRPEAADGEKQRALSDKQQAVEKASLLEKPRRAGALPWTICSLGG
jgi:hypothetical protein